jgi:hypothetical protein
MNGFADFPEQSFFEVHQTRLTREVLFEMPEAGVHDLFDTIEFGPEHFPMLSEALIHALVKFGTTLIDLSAQVSQALVVDQQADQNGQRRQSGGNGRNHHLNKRAHDNRFRS